MKKFVFFLVIFLVILSLYVFVSWQNKDEDVVIDITDTGFQYDIAVCDRYFELISCIIDRDTNVNYTKEMRIELKNMVKDLQEERRQLAEEELYKRCSDELENLVEKMTQNNVNSFGCFTWVN